MGVGIKVENLNAWYGKTQALYNIQLAVAANHATALDLHSLLEPDA
jgi:phosphate transport system ATP-binding protein